MECPIIFEICKITSHRDEIGMNAAGTVDGESIHTGNIGALTTATKHVVNGT